MISRAVYFPGLNGLRAIAALSVVIAHLIDGNINQLYLPAYFSLPMAQFAVTLFFVISGFLISYLLLVEKEACGINIKKFYIRRMLRIWPLYYLFIVVCIALALFVSASDQLLNSTIYWYLFFAANIPFIFNHSISILFHLWSIGVEEQFYAFWPWVIKRKNDKLIFIIVIAILILFSLKAVSYFLVGRQAKIYIFLSVLRFHSMMLGALGAIWYYNKNRIFIKITTNIFLQIFSWLVFFLIGFGLIRFPSLIAHEFIAGISVILILGQITAKNRFINLENNICNFLGQISYGIYIIHPLCIALFFPLLKSLPISVSGKLLLGFGIVMASTIILAHLSYQYYEKFFLKLKSRFTVVQTQTSNLPVVEKGYAIS